MSGEGGGGRGMIVGGFPLPERLAEARDPGALAWREDLPARVADVLSRWGLTAEAPFEPGGSSAWVAPVVKSGAGGAGGADGVGTPRSWALKVAYAHEESRDEAAGMLAWQGRGAAQLERSCVVDGTAFLLMERVRPGTPLGELLTGSERDAVTARLLRRLWVPPEQLAQEGRFEEAGRLEGAGRLGHVGQVQGPTAVRDDLADEATAGSAGDFSGFRPVAEMCELWAREAEERGHPGLPKEVAGQGLAWFRDLPREWDGEQVLLTTDLNPWNILRRGEGAEGSWVLIDPKPYVGDPHYDVLQLMLNDPVRLRADPEGFATDMAALTGLDARRTRRWLFARCVQESGVMPGAAETAMRLAPGLLG